VLNPGGAAEGEIGLDALLRMGSSKASEIGARWYL